MEAPPIRGATNPWWRLLRRVLVAFVIFMVAGNLLIVAASFVMTHLVDTTSPAAVVPGVDHLGAVDGRVWRGSAPASMAGYRALAAAGVTTVVDLRAEHGSAAEDAPITALGLDVVHLPIRDGQIPSQAQLDRFLAVVAGAKGTVFVHCAAGVGRTGTVVAAYLVATGQANGFEATARNLAVGPPSLEQIAFGLGLDGPDIGPPPLPVVAVSRLLDAPRRIWSIVG
ncbi:MAG TPA: dual specificity protein phosphatase family protein [Acidimicrobiales bacterium]|nr:dual specificity protein phosphatase family protein [Acidimicrobiales bacterium]